MKTRIVVHIAFDKCNKQVCNLICVAGRLIPFDGAPDLDDANRKTSFWFKGFNTNKNIQEWKSVAKSGHEAVRFQRVIIDGESE